MDSAIHLSNNWVHMVCVNGKQPASSNVPGKRKYRAAVIRELNDFYPVNFQDQVVQSTRTSLLVLARVNKEVLQGAFVATNHRAKQS